MNKRILFCNIFVYSLSIKRKNIHRRKNIAAQISPRKHPGTHSGFTARTQHDPGTIGGKNRHIRKHAEPFSVRADGQVIRRQRYCHRRHLSCVHRFSAGPDRHSLSDKLRSGKAGLIRTGCEKSADQQSKRQHAEHIIGNAHIHHAPVPTGTTTKCNAVCRHRRHEHAFSISWQFID